MKGMPFELEMFRLERHASYLLTCAFRLAFHLTVNRVGARTVLASGL